MSITASDMQTGIPTASAASAKLDSQLRLGGRAGGGWRLVLDGSFSASSRWGCLLICAGMHGRHPMPAALRRMAPQRNRHHHVVRQMLPPFSATHLETWSILLASPSFTASMAAPAEMGDRGHSRV